MVRNDHIPPEYQRLRSRLGRGAALSVLLHVAALVPLIAAALIFGQQEEKQRLEEEALEAQLRDESVDVSWETVSPEQLPEDLPEIDTNPPEEPEKLALPEAPQPEEPKPDTAKPEPAKIQPRLREKVVDIDLGQDVPAPDDARYLAQKNNRVAEETRATDTTLDRREAQPPAGAEPQETNEQADGPDDPAGSEDSEANSQMATSDSSPSTEDTPPPGQQDAREAAVPDQSVLNMRNTAPRAHDVTPETANPYLLPNAPLAQTDDGLLPTDDLPGLPGASARNKLRLSTDQLNRLFGSEFSDLPAKPRRRRQGRTGRRLARITQALENFIPEVKPGNQTALNTRAAPFAAFLARMHRGIHALWGHGFLWDLGDKPFDHPMNDRRLWTRLEIVLAGDGSVDNVKVIRSSGITGYDVAAVDVVYTAGPYPNPPDVIRSGNGKIYLHWAFHRDNRQCGTFNAEYFILDNAPDAANPTNAGSKNARGPSLGNTPSADNATTPHSKPGAAERLAKSTARRFFAGYVNHSVQQMLSAASYPFVANGGLSATSQAELRLWLTNLVEESGTSRRLGPVAVHTAAQLRATAGWMPKGFADKPELLFAEAKLNGETYIAVLTPDSGSWKVSGLIHR